MRYRKPEELKESGIEWIGEIPEDWNLNRIKYLSGIDSEELSSNTDPNYTFRYVDIGSVNSFGEIENFQEMSFENAPSRARKIVQKNDVIVSTVRTYLRAVARIDQDSDDIICSTGFSVLRAQDIDSSFLFYTIISKGFIDRVEANSVGVSYPAIGSKDLGNFKIQVPAKSEQHSIATYLDRKTEAIDGLIQKKEQLIERLKEKRQALITQVVTKGLDPNVQMKDSGIEWLGEIPEVWDTKDLKFIAEIHSSNVNKKSKEDEERVELCNYTDVYYNEFITNDIDFMEATAPDSKFDRFQLEVGDVIITKDSEDPNDIAVPALVAETKENLLCGYHLALIKCKNDILGEFLFRLFQSKKYREEFGNRSNGITRYSLGVHEIKNIEIALPSLDKQEKIIKNLNKQIKQIDNIISETRKSIPKLNEYRQSLISAAVTGKIDVRDEVQKNQTANIYFKRRVLAAKILDDLHAEPTMGRRKLQKILYLLEKEIEAVELKGKYQKDAAGPFDNEMMRSIEYQLENNEWFKRVERENGYGYKYLPMIKIDEYNKYYSGYWGNINSEIEELIELLRPEKTDLLSLVATLYACWNDFLIKDEEFDGKKLIDESRYNWYEEKKEIPYGDWAEALNWMWDNGLKPEGVGELTREKN